MVVGHAFEDIVDMIVYCSHSVKAIFCDGKGEFVVIIEVNSVWIKAIKTSI